MGWQQGVAHVAAQAEQGTAACLRLLSVPAASLGNGCSRTRGSEARSSAEAPSALAHQHGLESFLGRQLRSQHPGGMAALSPPGHTRASCPRLRSCRGLGKGSTAEAPHECLQVGHRIIPKRIHVRVEHVRPSRCREEFLKRQKSNDEYKQQAKAAGGGPGTSTHSVHKPAACHAEGCQSNLVLTRSLPSCLASSGLYGVDGFQTLARGCCLGSSGQCPSVDRRAGCWGMFLNRWLLPLQAQILACS